MATVRAILSGPRDSSGRRVSFRCDRMALWLFRSAMVLNIVVVATLWWTLWWPWWVWVVAAVAVGLGANTRLWHAMRRGRDQSAPPVAPLQRFVWWLAADQQQAAADYEAKAATVRGYSRVALLHKAEKSREAADWWRQQAGTP